MVNKNQPNHQPLADLPTSSRASTQRQYWLGIRVEESKGEIRAFFVMQRGDFVKESPLTLRPVHETLTQMKAWKATFITWIVIVFSTQGARSQSVPFQWRNPLPS